VRPSIAVGYGVLVRDQQPTCTANPP